MAEIEFAGFNHSSPAPVAPRIRLLDKRVTNYFICELASRGCASHLFHPPHKPWNFRPPPDIFAGMHKTIEIFLAIVREALS